ncbi:MAG TPA: alpha/beta hydrolase [Gaiellaceae bacterium]|nr:alpha/beta hydrolase [Gaiellaceae bacterium]
MTGPRLTETHGCPGQPGFICSTLTVPLDWSRRVSGTLPLAVASGPPAPRGVLLVLTGGPGQPGAPYIAKLAARLGQVARQYRVVTIDQRGTGAGALDCPALQKQMGFSDLQPPTASAVRACAAAIGPKRQFFGTDDVVRDLDRLRQALGVQRLSIDGTSYGTYVAERYALAYPQHTARLVLDSVVPQRASGQLETQAFPRVTQVLRNVCGSCADDFAADVRRYHDGPELLDLVVALSVFDSTYRGLGEALHLARTGDTSDLDAFLRGIRSAEAAEPANQLSQGLHASALCEDWLWPWGDSSAPLAGRKAALDRYAASLPASALGPFDRSTVTGNGIMQQCLYWPPTPPTPQPSPGARITAPALVLAGDRDLSTPLPWPTAELKLLTHGRLVFVHGTGHSTQRDPQARAAVQAFLLGG